MYSVLGTHLNGEKLLATGLTRGEANALATRWRDIGYKQVSVEQVGPAVRQVEGYTQEPRPFVRTSHSVSGVKLALRERAGGQALLVTVGHNHAGTCRRYCGR